MLKKNLGWFLALIFVVPLFIMVFRRNSANVKSKNIANKEIVTSCFPVCSITREVLSGINDFKISDLTSNYLGEHSCLHNYALTTDNAKSLENASVVIINGANFEPFVSKIPENKIVIDSSVDISLNDDENPYIWLSIDNYLKQVENISNELSKIFPDYKDKILKNTTSYCNKLQTLKNNWFDKFSSLKDKKIASFSEKFDYLFKDFNLNVIKLKSNHSHENEKSADIISYAVNEIKENNLGFFISTKNDSSTNEVIEKASGAKCIVLRSLDNPSDGNYIDQTQNNLEKIYETLNS